MIPRIALNELSHHVFQNDYVKPSKPLIITGTLGTREVVEQNYFLHEFVHQLGAATPVAVRCYGQEHLHHPERWNDMGYCPKQISLPAGTYESLIELGTAEKEQLYTVCDIAATPVGKRLAKIFDKFAAHLGLMLSNFGPTVTAWWGPGGHAEPLHCDIVDGTLWQLYGEKEIILFPDHAWPQLSPFPFGGKMSWGFSQIDLSAPDFERFPGLAAVWESRETLRLAPGEILYIPALWAHYVRGLTGSQHVLSVNRFWHTSMDKMVYLPDDVKIGLGISDIKQRVKS